MRSMFSGLAAMVALSVVGVAQGGDDFKPHFNGKDLTGWVTKTNPAEALDGKTEAYKGRFKVVDGNLVIDPKVKGDVWIQTAKDLAKGKDVHIKIEFMPGKGCNNDTFFRGNKFDITEGYIKKIKYDEWNVLEIIAKGKQVEYKHNGETLKTMAAKNDGSPLGLRAEFGPIQIRKILIKEMP
jgi:hypothetical protein